MRKSSASSDSRMFATPSLVRSLLRAMRAMIGARTGSPAPRRVRTRRSIRSSSAASPKPSTSPKTMPIIHVAFGPRRGGAGGDAGGLHQLGAARLQSALDLEPVEPVLERAALRPGRFFGREAFDAVFDQAHRLLHLGLVGFLPEGDVRFAVAVREFRRAFGRGTGGGDRGDVGEGFAGARGDGAEHFFGGRGTAHFLGGADGDHRQGRQHFVRGGLAFGLTLPDSFAWKSRVAVAVYSVSFEEETRKASSGTVITATMKTSLRRRKTRSTYSRAPSEFTMRWSFDAWLSIPAGPPFGPRALTGGF